MEFGKDNHGTERGFPIASAAAALTARGNRLADRMGHRVRLLPVAATTLLLAPCSLAEPVRDASGRTLHDLIAEHCFECHDSGSTKGGLDLEAVDNQPIGGHSEIWEKVVRRLRARQMPPAGESRPDEATYLALLAGLEGRLERHAARNPRPGRVDSFRRLNRTEYENAIRDLLALDIDAAALLPADESSHGFDNITVGNLSPTLLNRYVSAAQKISRLAVGTPRPSPEGHTFRIPPDTTQEQHVPGLPLGTRGGLLVSHTFPQDGEYEIRIRLTRDRNEEVEGLSEPHELEVLLDRERMEGFTVKPPEDRSDHTKVDAHLQTRIHVSAGPHDLGVTFVKKPSSLIETRRQPYHSRFNHHRHPRLSPAILEVSVTGPYEATGSGESPSRSRIFGRHASDRPDPEAAAREILATLARRAYRRPITDADLERPMAFFREASEERGFEAGIERALSSILVNPHFLFRIEKAPEEAAPGTAYAVSDLELASRLSFFLWSSIPDDELLEVAEGGRLRDPEVLESQTRRMLADPRSASLVGNFANQWLYLRNLDSFTPNARLFPDFDDNLRQAFKRETELLFERVLLEDRSVVDLLRADDTFLNERLAKHYGIPHVHGSRFRRVALAPEDHRGGLLRHGSILAVTSYATRTSPVVRGNWILENIIGTPPPPPPADVPALEDAEIDQTLPMRERLSEHRANPACASCHNLMDPVGFALENFDAVGRWRTHEEGRELDVSGGLPDGQTFTGIDGLEQGLLKRPELFAATVTEKLMTFALGRGVEHFDGPAVRRIVAEASENEYRLSSVILGIVRSAPFTMRESR